MLNQESADEVFDFHFHVFYFSFLNVFLIDIFVSSEHFILKLLVFHEMFGRHLALSFEFDAKTGQFEILGDLLDIFLL